MKTLHCAVVVLLCLVGVSVLAQQAGDPVLLDVIVDEARGTGAALAASDFTVREDDGLPLTVESARLVQSPSGQAQLLPVSTDQDERSAGADADRLVGVFVDEYHLDDSASFAALRSSLASFIRTSLGPRDLVVVLKPLDSLVSIRMTADREAAARIIEAATPRQNDYTARSSFEQQFIAGAPARIDAARNQIALSAVSALTTHLGRFPAGRKTLIVLSGGVSNAVPTRGESPFPGLDSIARTANRARVAVYLLRPSAATQAASPGTSQATAQGSTQATPRAEPLAALAERTTGLVVDGESAAAAGLQRVLRDASRYYLLTVRPSEQASDGRFRSVHVNVRRPGAVVRARSGYSVRRPEDDLRFTPPSLPEGLKIPRRTSPLIRTWFGQSSGDGGATTVDFVWEPAPPVPGGRGVVAVVPARVAMTVTTMEGAPVYSGSAGPSGPDRDFGTSEPPQMTFSSGPGTLLVQMEVLDLAGRVLDRDVRDLVVGRFTQPVAFGTPAVYRTRSNREFVALADGNVAATPVVTRQFSRAEHLIFRVPVVSKGDPPVVTARLQSRFGAVLRDLPTRAAPSSTNVVQVDLPLASLASGGYMLEFTARGTGGSAIDRVDFSVTP